MIDDKNSVFRIVQAPDLHGDTSKLEEILCFVEERKNTDKRVDAVYIPGDIIEGHGTNQYSKVLDLFEIHKQTNTRDPQYMRLIQGLHQFNVQSEEDLKRLSEEDVMKFMSIQQKIMNYDSKTLKGLVEMELNRFKPIVEELYDQDVYVIIQDGNHDIPIMNKKVFGECATLIGQEKGPLFLDHDKGEFRIGGSPGTYEGTKLNQLWTQLCGDGSLDYNLGYNSNDEDLDDDQKNDLKQLEQQEIQRIGHKPRNVDLFFAHKGTHITYGKSPSGVVEQYANGGATVFCGHTHGDAKINGLSPEDFLVESNGRHRFKEPIREIMGGTDCYVISDLNNEGKIINFQIIDYE